MKNADFRHFLEKEISRQLSSGNPLSQTQSDMFLNHLLKLHQSNVSMVLSQYGIHTATCGDLSQFVCGFCDYVFPVVNFYGKSIANKTVLGTRTTVVFSPRLVEIALGSMLHICLCDCEKITLNVRATARHIIVTVCASDFARINNEIRCIGKVAGLHSGRFIYEFSENQHTFHLLLPLFPHFQPLKFIPCSPELCRICRIWNFNG